MVETPLLHNHDSAVLKMQAADVAYLERYVEETNFDLSTSLNSWLPHDRKSPLLDGRWDPSIPELGYRCRRLAHIPCAPPTNILSTKLTFLKTYARHSAAKFSLGSLPTENISSCFRRFLGGSLQTRAPADHNPSDERRQKPGIGMLTPLPSACDNTRRNMPGDPQ